MYRRRGGVEGIYRCEIPDTFGFIQTLYIGVYSANTGEWYVYTPVLVSGRVNQVVNRIWIPVETYINTCMQRAIVFIVS